LSPGSKNVSLTINRNQALYFKQTLNVPKPGEEIALKADYDKNGGCYLRGSLYYLNKSTKKATLSKEQIDQLKALGYL